MANKQFQDTIHPRGEWVIFRRIKKKSTILRVDGSRKEDEYEAQVISHGPGEFQQGTFVPVEGLPAGTIVLVPANHCMQAKRWADHDIFCCPASSIIATLDAQEDMDFSPVIVVPTPRLIS